MDITQLTQTLNQLQVTPPDQLRACLYLANLTQTANFFSQTMAQTDAPGLGNNYPFVRQAVTDPSLLNELAKMLDYYVSSAVDNDMTSFFVDNKTTYQNYFTTRFLNSTTDDNSIQQFLGTCPITSTALQRLTTNFQQGILLACTRVIQDRVLIQRLFSHHHPSLTLTGLKQIESSGSDFHKGGKQVLFLTFSISYYFNNETPRTGELKIVYKPSDLEADCLITGNSAAINAALNATGDPAQNFMPLSLVEIFNSRVRQMMAANPTLDLEELPTYRFLPCNWLSQQPPGPALPENTLRNAYGYIEFLGYNLYGERFSIWNLYPLGASDYLIFYTQNEEPIISKFYRQIGQLVALAATFSIIDMHVENVRVNSYQPLFIDLEVSLTDAINDLDTTSLFDGGVGGITGYEHNPKLRWKVNNATGNGTANLQEVSEKPKYSQNRLWIVRSIKTLVKISSHRLLLGFINGMDVIQQCQQSNDFQTWFERLSGVVVRYVPFATSKFLEVRKNTFIGTPNLRLNAPLQGTIQQYLFAQATEAYEPYSRTPTPEPDLIVWQHPQVTTDYMNLDIPVFYHRIGTQDIMDSMGVVVPVQNQMQIITLNNANPPGQVPKTVVIGRDTFFPNVPTMVNVQQNQVQALTGANFNNRVQTLKGQILEKLGKAGVPRSFSVLVPRW